MGIKSSTISHPAVFTAEEASIHCSHLPGAHCKSLFLKDKNDALWLVVSLDHRQIDMKELKNILGSGRLSFGKPDLMESVLGVKPGSVSPFALVNDGNKKVNPVIDEAIFQYEFANFHPLTNTMTTTIKSLELKDFIANCGYSANIFNLDLVTKK